MHLTAQPGQYMFLSIDVQNNEGLRDLQKNQD